MRQVGTAGSNLSSLNIFKRKNGSLHFSLQLALTSWYRFEAAALPHTAVLYAFFYSIFNFSVQWILFSILCYLSRLKWVLFSILGCINFPSLFMFISFSFCQRGVLSASYKAVFLVWKVSYQYILLWLFECCESNVSGCFQEVCSMMCSMTHSALCFPQQQSLCFLNQLVDSAMSL